LFRPNKDVNIVVNEDKIPQEKVSKSDYLKPADPSFSIIIPKIGANSAVVANVDPHDSREYQRALTKGVAHAKGSVFPGQIGNTFLFSHSSVNVYDANRYNSVFYLLRKLNEDDVFYLIYQGEIYQYRVSETKIVEADDVKYLDANTQKNQATLMTCWPPGTTLQRLLVIGDLVSIQK
jgi:sortase A